MRCPADETEMCELTGGELEKLEIHSNIDMFSK